MAPALRALSRAASSRARSVAIHACHAGGWSTRSCGPSTRASSSVDHGLSTVTPRVDYQRQVGVPALGHHRLLHEEKPPATNEPPHCGPVGVGLEHEAPQRGQGLPRLEQPHDSGPAEGRRAPRSRPRRARAARARPRGAAPRPRPPRRAGSCARARADPACCRCRSPTARGPRRRARREAARGRCRRRPSAHPAGRAGRPRRGGRGGQSRLRRYSPRARRAHGSRGLGDRELDGLDAAHILRLGIPDADLPGAVGGLADE